jgi:hypothetical protein
VYIPLYGDLVMKKVILAATVVAASASASFAGTYGDPIVEPTVFVEEASSSSGSFGSLGGNAALLALGAAAVAVVLLSDSDTTTE